MQADNALWITPYRLAPGASWFENIYDGVPGYGVNWRYRDHGQTQPWTGEMAGWYDKIHDGNSTAKIKRPGGTVPDAIEPPNWVTWDVRPSVAQWYAGQENNGFVLFQSGFQGGGTLAAGLFYSREHGDASLRPYLFLRFEGARIHWLGSAGPAWDTNTLNWDVGGYPGTFGDGDLVLFDERARQGGVTIAAEGVRPKSVTFSNEVLIFNVDGGGIHGPGGLTKRGGGVLWLWNSNSYSGPTILEAGVVVILANQAFGDPVQGTTVRPGAALGLHNVHYTTPEPLALEGSGPYDLGALYVADGDCTYAGPVTFTGDTSIRVDTAQALTLTGQLSGPGGLFKDGEGTLTLSGGPANTYAGETHVGRGTLVLGRLSGPAVPGPLWIGDGLNHAVVRLQRPGQLSAEAAVTIRSGGLLDLNHQDAAVGRLNLQGGRVETGQGVLRLRGDVTATGDTAGQIHGLVDLDGEVRTLTVAEGAAADDLVVTASLRNGGLLKTGPGRLLLTGANLYQGGNLIAEGILAITEPAALGDLGATTVVTNRGTLELRSLSKIAPQPLLLHGDGAGQGALVAAAGSNVWAGPIHLGSSASVSAAMETTLRLDGPIHAAGHQLRLHSGGPIEIRGAIRGDSTTSLTKSAPGPLTLAGFEPNTYSGPTVVEDGILILNKTPGPAILGELILGHPLVSGSGRAVCAGPGQFAPDSRVTVNPRSVLELRQFDATLAGLTLEDGLVDTGEGTLHLHGPLRATGPGESRIVGQLSLGGVQSVHATGSGDLNLDARVVAGGFVKWGPGAIMLTNDNTFTEPCTISGGPVWVNNHPAQGDALGPAPILVETAPLLDRFEAVLGGTGSINGPVTVQNNGSLSPGPRPTVKPGGGVGTLLIRSNLWFGPEGILQIEVDPVSRQIDVVDLNGQGDLRLDPRARLRLIGKLEGPRPYVFVRRARSISGTFEGWAPGVPAPDQPGWYIHYGTQRIYFSTVPRPLLYFRALATNGVVLVSWRTAEEIESRGFDLFRDVGNGLWLKVNAEPIPAQNPQGAVYFLVDPTAQAGMPCRYRLVEYASGGQEIHEFDRTPTEFAFSGPVRVGEPTVELRWFSRVDEVYSLWATPDLTQPLTLIQTNLLATPPENVLILPTERPLPSRWFFRLELEP